MKKFYYSLILTIFCIAMNAQTPLILTYKTLPNNLTVKVPIVNNPGTNYTVNFGDGTILTNQTGMASHTYSSVGTYTVAVSGNFNQIRFGEFMVNTNAELLNSIEQWGSTQWISMDKAFYYCENLVVNATDAPNLNLVTDMSDMFSFASKFNQPINHWNVSNVTNMKNLFGSAVLFNQPLSNWNVSNVTDMSGLFSGTAFNQSLDTWDFSNVTTMEHMLSSTPFNQPVNSWDVSNVMSMKYMFAWASQFNQPLNNWDVSNVTDMSMMFQATVVFNQDISNWDTSSLQDISYMFALNYIYNQPLAGWNVSNVVNMQGVFFYAYEFNQDISSWDTSSVVNMQGMFLDANSFNQPLNTWNVSNVTNMEDMFYKAFVFNQPLNNWNVSNVTTMQRMFKTSAFNQNINSWNVSNVVNMSEMFQAYQFNQPLSNWDVSNVDSMNGMFYYATAFNQDISNWNFKSTVKFDDTWSSNLSNSFFYNCPLSIENYDALLLKFAALGLENKKFRAFGAKYCNTGVRNYLATVRGWNMSGDTVGPNCAVNTVTGTIRYDQNANGCDTSDVSPNLFLVSATNNTQVFGASVNNSGVYNLKVLDASYNVGLVNVPNYFTVNPASTTVSFTNFGNTENLNFCLTANQTVNDLNVTLLPITEARPGFTAEYQLVVQNMGTQNVANATVALTYDATKQTFVNAVPTTSATALGQLTFAISNLQALQAIRFDLVMQTLVPPIVNGGDVLNFTATVTPSTSDATPQDNTFALAQTAINSYDPNDKQVLQGAEILIEDADQYLDYIIRFQNTGSASAIFVRVEDELHENLDWSTLRLVSASHAYRVEITDGNHVEFIFDNINLPHEAANAAGSNGFIAYKIKPKQTIQVGDIMSGNASIFFDYNLPIITNSVSTEVVQQLGTPEFSGATVRVYPNPTNGMLYLQASGDLQIETATIFSLQGKELFRFNEPSTINLDRLSAGIYLLEVNTAQGRSQHKIVKQ